MNPTAKPAPMPGPALLPGQASASLSRPAEMRRIDRVVDVGYLVLVVVCAVRYVSHHGLTEIGGAVLAAAVLSLIAYGIGVLRAGPVRERVGITIATLIWIALVIVASSFAWCAFPLFFAVHRVYRGRTAIVMAAALVAAVGVSLYVLSGGQDVGLVLGPICGGVVLSMAYATLQRMFRARQELIIELTRTRDQLASSERDAGALAERHRVAVELHDTVVQGTASALLLLEAAEQTWSSAGSVPGADQIREAEAVLRGNLTQTRRIVHRLADEHQQLPDLPTMIRDATAPQGAEFEVVGEARPVPEEVGHALLRVAQEAVGNARRHADPAMIKITLTYHADSVGLDVADNGSGFDPDTRREPGDQGGYGLRAMAWRIESLGGEFDVDSRPGAGTIVAGVVPTGPSDAEEARS